MHNGIRFPLIFVAFLAFPAPAQRGQVSIDVSGVDELIEYGKYEEASRLIRSRFDLASAFGRQAETGSIFIYLGRLLVEVGRLADAEKAFRTAENLDERYKLLDATLSRDIAALALAQRDYDTAAKRAAEACRLSVRRGLYRLRVAYCHSLEALARLRLGDLASAERLIRSALKDGSSRISNPHLFRPRILYAACLVKSYRDQAGAEEDCNKGLKMAQARPDSRNITLGHLALAEIHLRAGKLRQSRESSLHCIQRTARLIGPLHQDTVQALELLALADLREGRPADARVRAEDALRIAKEIFGAGSSGVQTTARILDQVLAAQPR